MTRSAPLLLIALLVGCPTPPAPPSDGGTPFIPADWETAYAPVRECRQSPDHELSYIRVFASPEAETTYTTRTGEFAEGAILVKPEYADPDCTILLGVKAMRMTAGAWEFQAIDEDGVLLAPDTRCTGCHLTSCGLPPDGYLGTCALP